MEKPTILVVDDDPANATALVEYLHMSNFRTMIAPSGERALRQLELAQPDLILLDVLMPGIDGFETCRRLKEYETIRDIPVIFMTALSETVDKVKGFEVGGVDYLTKPIHYEEVLARIKAHLTIRRLQRQLQTQNAHLQENNEHLQQEIAIRKRIEGKLRRYHNHLEAMVEERTIELVKTNEQLQEEIAEHKRTEQALRASEQQYRLLAESVADGIVILQEEKLVFVNEALCSILGFTADQFLQIEPPDLFRDDYKEFVRKKIDLTRKGHSNLEQFWQAPCVTGDGREIWVETRHNFIEWEGKPAILVTVRDITERKVREIAIEEEKNHLKQVTITLRSTITDRYKFGDLIGRSPVMQEVYEFIMKAAATDVNVVISGESGVGKELVAQMIHQMSKRHKKTFVPVNCGAIPDMLFEREFFGHQKGAFTGAYTDKSGFFDLAHGGTLFLDEAGEIPLHMQVKLLRALEDGEYIPVGSNMTQKADVRIIAATNKNLETLVEQGLIREDIFYRLQVITMTVPPLRERKEDIPLLVDHFLQHYGKKKNQLTLPGKILEQLYTYHWPGNIRELQNVLRRYLTIGRLDLTDTRQIVPEKIDNVSDLKFDQKRLELREILEHVEKQVIINMLNQQHWHKSKTAAMLGIPRRSLYSKMKKHGLI
jgi:PAS domain S-box-containing protein